METNFFRAFAIGLAVLIGNSSVQPFAYETAKKSAPQAHAVFEEEALGGRPRYVNHFLNAFTMPFPSAAWRLTTHPEISAPKSLFWTRRAGQFWMFLTVGAPVVYLILHGLPHRWPALLTTLATCLILAGIPAVIFTLFLIHLLYLIDAFQRGMDDEVAASASNAWPVGVLATNVRGQQIKIHPALLNSLADKDLMLNVLIRFREQFFLQRFVVFGRPIGDMAIHLFIDPFLLPIAWFMQLRGNSKNAPVIPGADPAFQQSLVDIYRSTQDGNFNIGGYTGILGLMRMFDTLRQSLVQYLVRITKDGPLLSIGGGDGTLENELRRENQRVYMIDRSPDLARQAKEQGVPVIVADAHRLPFKDESMQTIVFSESIGHMTVPTALREAWRTLSVQGSLVITMVSSKFPHPILWGKYAQWTDIALRRELHRAGFLVEAITTIDRDDAHHFYMIKAVKFRLRWAPIRLYRQALNDLVEFARLRALYQDSMAARAAA